MSHRPIDRDRDPRERTLAELLSDAVADVTPDDRLAELRARTSTGRRRRPWLVAGGGAALATAAVVTAIALATGGPPPTAKPGPATHPATISESPSAPSSSAPAPSPTASAGPAEVAGIAVPVYYLGVDTSHGQRLYREFHRGEGDPLAAAVDALASDPLDPDYRTTWAPGQLEGASFDGVGAEGFVSVTIDPAARARPAGMSEAEATAAVQQVVYTMQAAIGARAPVQFLAGGEPADQVLGVTTAEPVTNAPMLDTLSLVNLTTPEEGATVSGSLDVEGVASSFEATVPWTIEDAAGDVVMEYSFMAKGWMGKLYPFSGPIDVSSLDPGRYTLIVETDDPTGGAEGPGPFSDTRTFVIE